MITFLIAIPATIFVLGVMILVHEWGHYVVAKMCGVRVEIFSLGFGKRLFGVRRGETDYRVSALPFGGYVKMAGENPLEARTGDPGEFMSHPRWQRFFIAIAGPAMNVLLAVGLLTVLFMFHFEHSDSAEKLAVIGGVYPGSPAAKAGLQVGDRLMRVGDVKDPKWDDVSTEMIKAKMSPGAALSVFVQRGSQTFTANVVPDKRGDKELDYFGWTPEERNIVTRVESDSPAAKADLHVGDEITAVNNHPVHSMLEVKSTIQQIGSSPATLTVLRDHKQLAITAVPQQVDENGEKVFRLGFAASDATHIDKLPFTKALDRSIQENKRLSMLIFDMLQKLAERKVSIKQMDGPVGIGKAAGEAARSGWVSMFVLMSLISMNLAIFNLLPIPILDGGLMLMLVVEALIRRDIDQRIKERMYQTAFVFLVLFVVVVVYNDVTKLL